MSIRTSALYAPRFVRKKLTLSKATWPAASSGAPLNVPPVRLNVGPCSDLNVDPNVGLVRAEVREKEVDLVEGDLAGRKLGCALECSAGEAERRTLLRSECRSERRPCTRRGS